VIETTPRTVEIVGVAGTGKSTLTGLLRDHGGALVADTLHTRRVSHLPYLVRGLPAVARLSAVRGTRGRRPDWDELKFVAYTRTWDRYLANHAPAGSRPVILDQGPVFALARLLWGGSRIVGAPTFDRWIDAMLDRWSRTLDAIVWLDASTDVVLRRINERPRAHEVKGAEANRALEVLRTHQHAYDEIRGRIDRAGVIRVVQIDTSERLPAELAETIADALGWRQPTRPDHAQIDRVAAAS
jgi:shikimate kinase